MPKNVYTSVHRARYNRYTKQCLLESKNTLVTIKKKKIEGLFQIKKDFFFFFEAEVLDSYFIRA